MMKESDFNRLLEIEEEYVKNMCEQIIALKPDLVITEKGLSGSFYFLFSFFHLFSIYFPKKNF